MLCDSGGTVSDRTFRFFKPAVFCTIHCCSVVVTLPIQRSQSALLGREHERTQRRPTLERRNRIPRNRRVLSTIPVSALYCCKVEMIFQIRQTKPPTPFVISCRLYLRSCCLSFYLWFRKTKAPVGWIDCNNRVISCGWCAMVLYCCSLLSSLRYITRRTKYLFKKSRPWSRDVQQRMYERMNDESLGWQQWTYERRDEIKIVAEQGRKITMMSICYKKFSSFRRIVLPFTDTEPTPSLRNGRISSIFRLGTWRIRIGVILLRSGPWKARFGKDNWQIRDDCEERRSKTDTSLFYNAHTFCLLLRGESWLLHTSVLRFFGVRMNKIIVFFQSSASCSVIILL